MKLALLFLAFSAFTHAAMDVNTMKPNHPDHPFSTLLTSVAGVSSRIFGGQEVAPHSFPYQVYLRLVLNDGEKMCGGSIISATTVLTAAHCVDPIKRVVAFFGLHDLTKPSGTYLQVDQVIIHPAWNRERSKNDIAILRFNKKIELNEHTKLVNLPTRADISNDFAGEMATASGWGRYSNASPFNSPVLRSVDVPVISNKECKPFWVPLLQPTHLCIGTAGGRQTCQGDSGGPLVTNNKLIGITSFGRLECHMGTPVVFTRVTEYLDWIEQNSDVVIG